MKYWFNIRQDFFLSITQYIDRKGKVAELRNKKMRGRHTKACDADNLVAFFIYSLDGITII